MYFHAFFHGLFQPLNEIYLSFLVVAGVSVRSPRHVYVKISMYELKAMDTAGRFE